MPFPLWLKIVASALGLLVCLGHVVSAVVGTRSARTPEQRTEAAGAIVPGVAGLLLVATVVSPSRPLSLLSACAALPTLVLGRAVYELVAFHKSS
jgi:hypothetical protein